MVASSLSGSSVRGIPEIIVSRIETSKRTPSKRAVEERLLSDRTKYWSIHFRSEADYSNWSLDVAMASCVFTPCRIYLCQPVRVSFRVRY